MQERFMVRTRVWKGSVWSVKNTLAENRAQAIRQSERIGVIRSEDVPAVRAFLEETNQDELMTVFSVTPDGFGNSSTIYKID
jgi:hypothetical protein